MVLSTTFLKNFSVCVFLWINALTARLLSEKKPHGNFSVTAFYKNFSAVLEDFGEINYSNDIIHSDTAFVNFFKVEAQTFRRVYLRILMTQIGGRQLGKFLYAHFINESRVEFFLYFILFAGRNPDNGAFRILFADVAQTDGAVFLRAMSSFSCFGAWKFNDIIKFISYIMI